MFIDSVNEVVSYQSLLQHKKDILHQFTVSCSVLFWQQLICWVWLKTLAKSTVYNCLQDSFSTDTAQSIFDLWLSYKAEHQHIGRCRRHRHSGISFQYRIISVPDWFRHRHYCSFVERTDPDAGQSL
jgi:hypothetical protein